MANPPPSVGQSYFWGSGVSQQQNMGYYSVPSPNFPPPNFRQPPPSYNMPVSTLSENKTGNYTSPYHSMGTCYQNEVSNAYHDVIVQIGFILVNCLKSLNVFRKKIPNTWIIDIFIHLFLLAR